MLGAIAFKVGSVMDSVGVTWSMLYGLMIKGSENEWRRIAVRRDP